MNFKVAVVIVIGILILVGLATWYIWNRYSYLDPETYPPAPAKPLVFVPASKRTTVTGKPLTAMTTRNGKLMSVDPNDNSSFGQMMMLQLPEWEMKETCGYLAPDQKEYATVLSITVNGIEYEADGNQCVIKLCHGDIIEGLPGQTQQYKLVMVD